jgi:hypothetical protein
VRDRKETRPDCSWVRGLKVLCRLGKEVGVGGLQFMEKKANAFPKMARATGFGARLKMKGKEAY